MASSLFQNKSNQNPTNPVANNPMQMIQQFMQFKQQMAGKNPKAMVDELIQSGQMSKEQFESLESQAKGILSMFGK